MIETMSFRDADYHFIELKYQKWEIEYYLFQRKILFD